MIVQIKDHIVNYQFEWMTLYSRSTEMWGILTLLISADQPKKGIRWGEQGIV